MLFMKPRKRITRGSSLKARLLLLIAISIFSKTASGIEHVEVTRHDEFEVVIAGGSTAAFAAAIASAKSGAKTALLEPTDWVGGQLTASAVPAIDEAWHKISDPDSGAGVAQRRTVGTHSTEYDAQLLADLARERRTAAIAGSVGFAFDRRFISKRNSCRCSTRQATTWSYFWKRLLSKWNSTASGSKVDPARSLPSSASRKQATATIDSPHMIWRIGIPPTSLSDSEKAFCDLA